ncbi:hypothetical protein M1615_05035 [Patescibacteria group bacterium]|nr:hypothetical protein [Patescibacteria group bacterium]MCL5010062.1 hypothetical protein [Patescibacteria group bacterium]
MRRRKRPFIPIFFAAILAAGLGYVVFQFSPDFVLPTGFPFIGKMPAEYGFFFIFFFFIFFSVWYALRSKLQGALMAIFATAYLMLRALGFKNVFFLVLFLALLVTLEFLFGNSKRQ